MVRVMSAVIERNATATLAFRLPPFGRKVLALRAQGLAPMYAALVVDGWEPVTCEELGQYAPWVIVIPDEEPASRFDFRPLAGLHVVVMAANLSRVDELALQIDRFEPKSIWGWPEDREVLIGYARGKHAQ